MMPATISLIALAVIFGGALLGMFLRGGLPQSHLGTDTRDVVRLGTGLIGTLSALVVGLMIASAKGSHDTQSGYISRISADVVLLDRILSDYGPEANEARDLLRRGVAELIDRIWREGSAGSASAAPFATAGTAQAAFQKIQTLSPKNDEQRSLQARAVTIASDMEQTRFLLSARTANPVPAPFLVILVAWLAIIFASFSLFAPTNSTLIVVLFLLAASAAGAIFLILDLSQPFSGLMTISNAPLRSAIAPR